MIKDTVKLVRDNWALADKGVSESPVTVSDKEIIRRITQLWNKVEEFSGQGGGRSKHRKKSDRRKEEKEEVLGNLEKLFDILYCTCEIVTCEEFKCDMGKQCKVKAHITYTCPKQSKVPVIEIVYIRDQRLKVGTKGQYQMGKVDVVETLRQVKCAEGQAKHQARKDSPHVQILIVDQNFKCLKLMRLIM